MFTIADIRNIVEPLDVILRNDGMVVQELAFDSRKIINPSVTLFFAIKTERNDGHLYIESLIEQGVRNFIITDPVSQFESYSQCNFLQVKNSVDALHSIAARHRKLFNIPVIGITGSNGKTIVKEWLSQVLNEEYRIVKNPNSYNSQIGVPVSVWNMNSGHTLGLFEAGISQPGEMEKLSRIISPTLGILTNIGNAHAQYFPDNQVKLAEKMKLFAGSEALVYQYGKEVDNILDQKEYRHIQRISWGENPNALYRITERHTGTSGSSITINGNDIHIPFQDAASVENAMQVAVTMLYLDYDIAVIQERLSSLTALPMRMEILEAMNNSIVINDTYSLDQNSLHIALDFLNTQNQYPKKTIIISDFEQAGIMQDPDYKTLNNLFSDNHISRLIGVGPDLFVHQSDFTIPGKHFYHTTEELINDLENLNINREAILVKGARNYHFERIINALQLRTHRTILTINLPSVIHNLQYYKSLLNPETKIVAMVKALCYGVGDIELINELSYHNVDYFAVAYADEGVHLRKRHINKPVIVLGAEAHTFETMVRYRLEPEIFNLPYLKQWEKTLESYPETDSLQLHLKLDTGMHRLGFGPDELDAMIGIIRNNPRLKVASVFSHLAASEDPSEDEFSRRQIRTFREMADKIANELQYPVLRHILNSSGIIRFPEAQFDMVRLGLGLYGITPVETARPHLQNPITLTTLITQIKKIVPGETIGYNRTFTAEREMEVAVIPIGYADGYPRTLSNGIGEVICKNRKVPVVGKISMDMSTIDVTGLNAREGDEVIIYGEGLSVEQIARKAGMIPYELLTSISRRIPRIYIME